MFDTPSAGLNGLLRTVRSFPLAGPNEKSVTFLRQIATRTLRREEGSGREAILLRPSTLCRGFKRVYARREDEKGTIAMKCFYSSAVIVGSWCARMCSEAEMRHPAVPHDDSCMWRLKLLGRSPNDSNKKSQSNQCSDLQFHWCALRDSNPRPTD